MICSYSDPLKQPQEAAAWDVLVLQNGEPLFSRRCADKRGAR
jgi:hypothetical protein